VPFKSKGSSPFFDLITTQFVVLRVKIMLTTLRRKLVVLVAVATLFLVVAIYFAYQPLSIYAISSLVKGGSSNSHSIGSPLQETNRYIIPDSRPLSFVTDTSMMRRGKQAWSSSETALVESSMPVTVPSPEPGVLRKALVVAKTKAEDTDWIHDRLAE
jgi:acyl-coenzyme A synthetase/AMP-(fatty) acid ligase